MFAFATTVADNNGWEHMNGWGGGWMWLWGVVMMVLFVMAIVWLIQAAGGPARPTKDSPTDPAGRARAIVAERYASGELTTEEYRERVNELQ